MSVSVTLHVFSGRPNPTWTLSDKQASELTDRLAALTTMSNVKARTPVAGLGYRGFSIGRPETPFATHVLEGVVDPGDQNPSFLTGDRAIEEWLLKTAGGAVPDVVRTHVEAATKPAIADNMLVMTLDKAAACAPSVAVDAPAYTPATWNVPSVQPFNNCYNYANNQITNTFAQPGRATGLPITGLSCPGVQPSAVSDGLVASANFATPLAAGKGWYVALVIWPGQDYHWYRQDTGGCWSHKPGSTAARNTDNASAIISDPRTCDRGPYSVFCSYMITNKGVHIK